MKVYELRWLRRDRWHPKGWVAEGKPERVEVEFLSDLDFDEDMRWEYGGCGVIRGTGRTRRVVVTEIVE